MDKNRINQILGSDSELESLMSTAMGKVGKEHDAHLISELASMDEQEFRCQLALSQAQISKQSAISRFLHSSFVRAVAACVACALMIWGVTFLPLSDTKSSGYASMFNQYYSEYNVTPFDAQGDNLNIKGGKSTAQLIQEASMLLSQRSRQNTRQAIDLLEKLLDNPWRKTNLDPEIRWYLGLAYLKDGQKSKASMQFEIVKATGKGHATDASALLQEIGDKGQR